MGKVIIFALVAIGLGDQAGIQTIGYYATAADCQTDLNRVLPQINRNYVKLDCIPLKVEE
jgi:hypothetical protein